MSKWIQKLTRTSKRGMACAMVAALALSSLAQAPSSEAAGKKKPTLNVKKKTLYWNKSGSKNYTLKLKKNKVKTIVTTTWKTSKKSVVALSRKKDTSVRLTAKKKGTATITATVKYVPVGKWAIKTAKLTCKVTSKGTAPAQTPPAKTEPAQTPLIIYTTMPAPPSQPVVTEEPTDTPEPEDTSKPDTTSSPNETADPDKSQEPTFTPNTSDDSTVTEVVLSTSEALLGMEKGRNTITLTATAKDKDGKPLENQAVTWTSDDKSVAAVKEGIVTAAGSGTAHIIATVNNVTSKPCTIIVDAEKPIIKEAELSDGKTFFVAFSEPVTGTPSINVKTEDNTTIKCESLVLSEDGKSLIIACQETLSAGSYELTINGLEDLAGNKMAEDSHISVQKISSVPTAILCKTDQVPAGQTSFDVYFSIVDQYGEEYDTLGVMSEGVFTASAQTETGMPFKAQVNQQEGYVRVFGSASAFTEGRKIKLTLTYSVSDETVVEENMTITLVDATDKGKAVKIAGLNATSKTMDKISSTDDEDKPVFQLSGTEKDNVFTLSSKLLDKFGYEAEPSDVIYMIKDESILAFSGTDEAASDGIYTSSQPVTVRALKGGTTTITAYLASDDSEFYNITVTIKSTSLQEITVADLGEGTNGKMSEAKITLTPAGTGLTKDDLKYRVTEGDERLKKLVFVQEIDGIYINITAFPDSRDDPIRFVVYSDGAESKEISYTSTPSLSAAKIDIEDFKENTVTAGSTATTTYQILNRYDEDITNRTGKQPECGISVPNVVKSASTGIGDSAGTLTIETLNPGTSEVTLSLPGDSSVNAKVNVTVLEKAYVQAIQFGTATMDGLKLTDKSVLFIPVQAYDQHKNKYNTFTRQTIKDEDLIITVNGKEIDSSPLLADYYETTSSTTAIQSTDMTTKIGAIGLKWRNTTMPAAGEVLKISFQSKRTDLDTEPYHLPVKAASSVSRLEFHYDVQAALPGAAVSNTLKLIDQYEEEASMPDGQNLYVSVLDQDGKIISSNPIVAFPSAIVAATDPITVSISNNNTVNLTVNNVTDNKEYTIQVYLGDSHTKYDTATVKESYKLLVDSADNLLEKIEISNIADKSVSSTTTPFPLDSYYVNLRASGTKLAFNCNMYTHYQGKDVEIAWKDTLGASVFNSNNLIWKVTTSEKVIATMDTTNKNTFTLTTSSTTDPIDDVATVSLTYISEERKLSDERIIKVSNKPAMPQGKYQIIINGDNPIVNYLDKSNTAEISTQTTFKLVAKDQYGDTYENTSLFTVISSKGLFTIDTTSFPTVNSSFHVSPATSKPGEVDIIKVYVTKDDYYEFTVKYVESAN